ncbi:MAG: nucleoside-diphosphate kinase [Gemmatimonadales bacterium]
MSGRYTLAMIKPDAVEGGKGGRILAGIEDRGFAIRAMRLIRMTRGEAEAFYQVHRGRPFFDELVAFMSSGPTIVLALEKADAVAAWRNAIGATDPGEAAPGTIRRDFAESKGRNAVHGSDSEPNAAREIAFFFPERELAHLGVTFPS